jgi:hypothetical protein
MDGTSIAGRPSCQGCCVGVGRSVAQAGDGGSGVSARIATPIEEIVMLRRRSAALRTGDAERQPRMTSMAELYDISRALLYRSPL